MRRLFAIALLSTVAACRSSVEIVDRDRADEIPREAALAYLLDLDRQGALGLTPSEAGLARKGRKAGGPPIPYGSWTVADARMFKVLNESSGEIWIESKGLRAVFYSERTAGWRTTYEEIQARLKRVLQALGALGVRDRAR